MKRRQSDSSRAVAYLRISTDAERQAHGLDVQRRSVEAWALAAGVTVVSWRQDELSGRTVADRRPGLGAALVDLRQLQAGRLIVHRLDRLARDLAEALTIERLIREAGASLVAVESGEADDPASKFLRQVMLAAAEFEGAVIRERIRATKASLRERGLFEGGEPPYGCSVEGGRLVAHPGERQQLAQLQAWRAEGLSWRALARRAAEEGVVNRRGRPWLHADLARLLRRGLVQVPGAG